MTYIRRNAIIILSYSGLILVTVCKPIGETVMLKKKTKETDFSIDNDDFTIEQRSLISDFPYFTGIRDYSLKGDGKPPYRYDLIAIEIKRQNLFVFGFPFKFLAKTIVESLIEKKKYLEKANFFRPNLDRLIKQSVEESFDDDYFKCHFSSLGLVLTKDLLLTSIDLGGERPMDSPLYKAVFKNIVQENQSHLESCALKCEVTVDEQKLIPKTRGNVHLDHFGNMKVYVHGRGKNVFVIPFVLELLRKRKCNEKTLNNPLLHLRDD